MKVKKGNQNFTTGFPQRDLCVTSNNRRNIPIFFYPEYSFKPKIEVRNLIRGSDGNVHFSTTYAVSSNTNSTKHNTNYILANGMPISANGIRKRELRVEIYTSILNCPKTEDSVRDALTSATGVKPDESVFQAALSYLLGERFARIEERKGLELIVPLPHILTLNQIPNNDNRSTKSPDFFYRRKPTKKPLSI